MKNTCGRQLGDTDIKDRCSIDYGQCSTCRDKDISEALCDIEHIRLVLDEMAKKLGGAS